MTLLPDLSSEYILTDEQIETYQRDGHVYLPNVCSPEEVLAYRPVIAKTAHALFPTHKPHDTNRPFLQKLNLRYHSDGVAKFVFARRFAKIVVDLMRIDGVRIFHEQALFKEPKGAITPWHQDQYYWPLATNNAMGMWMPLVDISISMGPIRFASASHLNGFIGQYRISDESESVFKEFIEEKRYKTWQQPMYAGDATFHNGWTIHGATENHTHHMREAMIVTYYEDGTRVDELSNPSRVHDAKTFLGGRKAGELADSEMNRVLYQK